MSVVKFICNKNRKRKDGRHPITLRITDGNSRKYIASGFYCHLDEWDDENESVNRIYRLKKPSRTLVNTYLLKHRAKAEEIHNQFIKEGLSDYSSEQFMKLYSNSDNHRITTFMAFERRIEELSKTGRIGNAEIYKTTLQAFRKFCKRDLLLRDVNPDFLEEWSKELKASGAKETTISAYMRTLRALFNYAIQKRWIRPEYYPFRDFKISQFSVETTPRALDADKLEKLLTMDVFPDQQLARDIFVFSFFGRGISFIDIALLTNRNIHKNQISYERKKLSKKPVQVTFIIRPEIQEIIDRYSDDNRGYLLPILNKNIHKTEQQKKDRIKKVRRQVNKTLNNIGKQLGEDNLTSYVARHSYASYMFQKGMSPMMIKESLHHKNLKTTEIYIKSLGYDAINDFENKIYSGLKS
jgi:site-specific recombinase XerD